MAPEGFTHPPAAQLFEDAVMRDGLPDEGVGVRHLPFILGCSLGQVNEPWQRHEMQHYALPRASNGRR